MADQPIKDQFKEKFRPDSDSALDREIEAALEGISLENLYGADKTQQAPPAEPGAPRA